MTTRFAFGAATIAIATSLASAAHAQEVPTDELVTDSDPATVQSADFTVLKVPVSLPAEFSAGFESTPALDIPALGMDTNISIAVDTLPIEQLAAQINSNPGRVTLQSVDPLYGDINPFYGDIGAFWGDIDAFWGDINPFYGDINPFYGDINPFYGDISPFYGDIDAFWGDIDAFYGDIGAFDATHLELLGNFWAQSGAQMATTDEIWGSLRYTSNGSQHVPIYDGTPDQILGALGTLIDQAEAQFGAAYEAETGRSFRNDFVTEILARHGVDLDDKVTLAGKSANDRAAFFLDWHDSLMGYSGIDHVDHWMSTINWTPSITQIQGSGKDTVIGIVDGSFASDADLGNNIIWSGGNSNALNGHGAGVASLIAGAHDGEGVMGIAPDVNITTYNPFGDDGSATWDDVGDAIVGLKTANLWSLNGLPRTSIINLSLGESGWVFSEGLADTLSRSDVDNFHNDTVFVIAAGNDGVTQTVDVEFRDVDDVAAIFVGSINPAGEISSFSNRPGNTCLLDNGVCHAGNELYLRTVVAPGELILVSDGQGGVARRSGTSFAAPLVSGAISLLHDRWPWLAQHPHETAEIIFRSARDLGEAGPDPIYGHGLLDVTASQSPLNFNAMTYTMYQREGNYWQPTRVSTTTLLGAGIPDWWETDDVFFSMFEQIGDTERDFIVPIATFTFGKKTNALGRGFERLQDFLNDRFANWILSNGSDSNGDGVAGINQVRTSAPRLQGEWTLQYNAMMPRYTQEGTFEPVHSAMSMTDPSGDLTLTFGHGQGSMALSGYRFGVIGDHDQDTGGVNPVLGFASGEIFAAAAYEIAPGTEVRLGYSGNREEWDEIGGVSAQELQTRRNLGAREATALTLDIEQRVSSAVSLNAQYTRLREDNALLGVQTSVDEFLGKGSATEAMTVSATIGMGDGLSFDLSATGARTETAKGQLFNTAGNVWSTAGQFTATKRGLFGAQDTLRVSIAQPLKIEQGDIALNSRAVIDRETGETGIANQTIGIETKRRVTGEIVYAAPLGNSSQLGLFGRYVSAGDANDGQNYVVGANWGMRF